MYSQHTSMPIQVKKWMDSMRLKMNEGKTEFIIIGSGHQIAKCSTTPLNVNNIEVQRSSVIKYLGTHTWMKN